MSFKKGLFLGSIISGAAMATYVAYRSLDEEKQLRLRNKILDAAEDAKDRAVDYAYYAADSLAETKDIVNDKVDDYKETFADTTDKVNDKLDDLKDDLSQLQSYLNRVPSAKNHLRDEEKSEEADDITVDMDDTFAPENDGNEHLTEQHRK